MFLCVFLIYIQPSLLCPQRFSLIDLSWFKMSKIFLVIMFLFDMCADVVFLLNFIVTWVTLNLDPFWHVFLYVFLIHIQSSFLWFIVCIISFTDLSWYKMNKLFVLSMRFFNMFVNVTWTLYIFSTKGTTSFLCRVSLSEGWDHLLGKLFCSWWGQRSRWCWENTWQSCCHSISWLGGNVHQRICCQTARYLWKPLLKIFHLTVNYWKGSNYALLWTIWNILCLAFIYFPPCQKFQADHFQPQSFRKEVAGWITNRP